MIPEIYRQIASIISDWPLVSQREKKTQTVFLVSNIKFCWLSKNAAQLRLPLWDVRRLERAGDEVRVIRQKTGRIEVVYHDPGGRLLEYGHYPGFYGSQISLAEALDLIRQSYDNAAGEGSRGDFDEQHISTEMDVRPKTPGTPGKAGHIVTDDLVEALETVLTSKANRFINNRKYVAHVERCIETLALADPRLAFLFGGLDAMQQDFGSAAQMTRPPLSRLDVSSKDNRLKRLQRWLDEWGTDGRLPFQKGL